MHVQLYDSVEHFFQYPSIKLTCWNDQISWRTVYNLYVKSQGNGHGHGYQQDWDEGFAEFVDEDWMDAIEA